MKVFAALTGVAALLAVAAVQPAHAGLIGADVTYEGLFPDETTVAFSVPQQTITAATSIADTTFDTLTSTFTDTAINALFTGVGGSIAPDNFNGSAYLFSGVDITGATLDASTSSDLSGAIVTFDASEIFINLAGLDLTNLDHFTIDVTSTAVVAVPEPASLAVLAMGLTGLGLVRRTRS